MFAPGICLVNLCFGMLAKNIPYLNNFPTILFVIIIMAWGESVRSRIIQQQTRHLLYSISWLLLSLFVIRLSKWLYFEHSTSAYHLLNALYYIPQVFVPLLSFLATVRLDKVIATPSPSVLRLLKGSAVLMTVIILTNDLHNWLFWYDENGDDHCGWFYIIILIWSLLLSLLALSVLIRCCFVPMCRRRFYIPLLMSAAGLILLAVFIANGGSPSLFGIKLFYMQEGYALIYIGMWEGCIHIGLLPSNTGYRTLFLRSHISAELTDAKNQVHYSSIQVQTSIDPDDLVRFSKPISGGTVTWTEDIRSVRILRGKIAEANESLAEENDLIEEENRITAERLHTETQNRLYDRIAAHSHRQLAEIAESFTDTDTFFTQLRRNILLGTYVKRNANLMLLAGRNPMLPAKELLLSLRETMDNLRLFSIDCELKSGSLRDIPAQMIIPDFRNRRGC